MSRNDTLYMKKPASWPGDLGREATPVGNGRTGALVQGGAGEEVIILNRNDVWYWWEKNELPRLEGALQKTRELIDAGDYYHANDVIADSLREKGYRSQPGTPFMLGGLRLKFETDALFSHYRRNLYMDKAECEITYRQKAKEVSRKCFISRKDDTFYYEYIANEETQITLSFDLYDDETPYFQRAYEMVQPGLQKEVRKNGIDFEIKTDVVQYGVKIRIFGAAAEIEEGCLKWKGKTFRLAVKCWSGKELEGETGEPEDFVYEEVLKEHLPFHRKLYHSVDVHFAGEESHTNEELLAEAYDTQASPELIEKMWRFGRYLFVCGTCEGGTPYPLYGLWHSKYAPGWPQNVANENVEMIYWHTNTGGLTDLVRPLIDYYYSGMDIFRDNADKLFGCKGIFAGVYTTPANLKLSTLVPVILNFTGVAGWLSQHFYKYYCMTKDRELLNEKVFPFMLAAADFYLDYITYGKDGKIVYYPSVSPENTPENLITPETEKRSHDNPVAKNAVIEIAIVKELFTNLISLIRETGAHTEYLPALQKALADMPPYLVNSDGALKEWADEELQDHYPHRHVSHIYPLFPGEEITKETDPVLYEATARAVDLRKLGSQSGWSLAHMAAIYAVLERGERVAECLDTLLKGCTISNFFTLHNDYRNMGVALSWKEPPVQMDAGMGFVNAVQMMLLQEVRGCLRILPALPKRLGKGSVTDFHFTNGRVSMEWDRECHSLKVEIILVRKGNTRVELPEGFRTGQITVSGGSYEISGSCIEFGGEKDAKLIITC